MCWIIFCSTWVICGVLAYGGTVADFYEELGADDTVTRSLALMMAISGYIGFVVVLFCSSFFRHGFQWRRK